MIIFAYIILYVIVHMIFQKLIGESSNRLALILTRDSGAMGVISFVGYHAGNLNIHGHYPFLFWVSVYFMTLSLVSFIFIKRQKKTNALTGE